MKKLMNRAGLLAAAFALALAVALALNAATQTPEVAQAQTTGVAEVQSATCDPKSHDRDGNGLIDICTPAQLNAMRWDLDGDGMVSGVDHTEYAKSFIIPPCTTSIPCKGYELMEDISLDDLPSDKPWTAIGPWQAVFDGNGFSITGLEGQHGLFDRIGVSGDNAVAVNAKTVVRNVDVVGAKITISADRGGGVLAVLNRATIIGSYVTGEITRTSASDHNLGGLVATNRGTIIASVADVDVKVTNIRGRVRVGSFAGVNHGDIHRSYAYGDVIDARADDDRRDPTTNPGRFDARGFAVNHIINGGTIASSLSYGDEIVTDGDLENAEVLSKSLAKFAYRGDVPSISPLPGGLITNSCALRDEWEFTCLTPTPTN